MDYRTYCWYMTVARLYKKIVFKKKKAWRRQGVGREVKVEEELPVVAVAADESELDNRLSQSQLQEGWWEKSWWVS